MRILFDQAAHDMRNKGNNALLQVALDRLMIYWPDAIPEIITLAPNLTQLYFPTAVPVSPDSLNPYESFMGKIFHLLPKEVCNVIFELREEFSHRQSNLKHHSFELIDPIEHEPVEWSSGESFDIQPLQYESISKYDLVVASGGGYFCDSDKPRLLSVFDRLEQASKKNIPAVMVSQGIGPLNDHQLRSRTAQVLPKLDLICVRETKVALPILRELNIPEEKIMMTGDDAIELAFKSRNKSLGKGVGISLRITSYTKVGYGHIDIIQKIIQAFARKYNAPLVSIPISSAHHESDISHIKKVMKGYSPVDIGWRKLDSPDNSIKRAGHCRIVITGTYHGAIFALAQGIPVIGLANSDEYFYKLSGLTDEFGQGCQVIHLDDREFAQLLSHKIDQLWGLADKLRPELLTAAARQIKWGYIAYQQINEIVANRKSI